jgi:adenylate cyclase
MADSAPPEDASPHEPKTTPAAGRWAKLWGQLKRFRGPIAAIAAFGAVLSGLLGYWSAYQTVEKVVAPKLPPAVAAGDAGPLSVVVLPFQNLTGDPSQEYVADGLTAGLTADLSRIRDAFVVNTKTAFAYKDKPVTAQQVGKDLGVRFVLQGSVQRSGNKIRISAQLADATSNAQLWSENFDGDLSDLFALQDRVTTQVGNSIGRKMVIVAARESEMRTSSPKAADLMLRARALAMKPSTLKNLQQSEDLYRQALALEPGNASTMGRLA